RSEYVADPHAAPDEDGGGELDYREDVRDDRVRIRRARGRRFERGEDHDQDADVDESEDRHQDLHRSTRERIPAVHGDRARSSGPGYKGRALPCPNADHPGPTRAISPRKRDSVCKQSEGG